MTQPTFLWRIEMRSPAGAVDGFEKALEPFCVAISTIAETDSSSNYKCPQSWLAPILIVAARYPAPKPLSMLTTPTPGAQELSIASSAARPARLAP